LKETVMMETFGVEEVEEVEGFNLPAEGWGGEGVEGFIIRA
jgi:hypothetical protein